MFINTTNPASRTKVSPRLSLKPPLNPDPRSFTSPGKTLTHLQMYPPLVAARPAQLRGPTFQIPEPPHPSRVFLYFLPDQMDLEEHRRSASDNQQVLWTTTLSTHGFRFPDVIYFPLLHRFFLGFDLIAEQYEYVPRAVIPRDHPSRKSPPSGKSPWSEFPRHYHKDTKNLYKSLHRRKLRVARYCFVTNEDILNLGPGWVLRVKARRV